MGLNKAAALGAFIALAVLASSAFAAAAPAAGQANGAFLQVRYQQIACRIGFAAAVTNEVAGAIPGGSSQLSADYSGLGNDKSQLSSLASAGDPTAFDSFVSGTLTHDLASDVADLHSARQSFRNFNVSNDTRAQLNSGYQQADSAMGSCEQSAVGALLQARITQFSNAISGWEAKISDYGAKGYDTSAMQSVVDGANSDVISPLQSALSGGDQAQMKAALQTYCLDDACNGPGNSSAGPYNYHGSAHFALATLTAAYNRVAAMAANVSTTVPGDSLGQAQQSLSDASSLLSGVGTAKYAAGQSDAIFGDLKQAQQDINSYVRDLRQAMQQRRQAMMQNRTVGSGSGRGMMPFNGSGRNFRGGNIPSPPSPPSLPGLKSSK